MSHAGTQQFQGLSEWHWLLLQKLTDGRSNLDSEADINFRNDISRSERLSGRSRAAQRATPSGDSEVAEARLRAGGRGMALSRPSAQRLGRCWALSGCLCTCSPDTPGSPESSAQAPVAVSTNGRAGAGPEPVNVLGQSWEYALPAPTGFLAMSFPLLSKDPRTQPDNHSVG